MVAPLKESSTSLPPALLDAGILAIGCSKQRTGKLFDRQTVSAGRDDQLTQLLELAHFKLPGPVVERFQLGIIVTGFSHGSVLSC